MESYKNYPIEEFERRSKINPRYSLRAFARDLEVSPSHLSELMNGKHGLSPAKAALLAEKLKLDQIEREYFCSDAESKHARGKIQKQNAMFRRAEVESRAQFKNLQAEEFKRIRDWYHLAVLEVLKLDDKLQNGPAIAGALGISTSEATEALRNLENGGHITISKDKIKIVEADMNHSSSTSSRDIRYFHKQILNKAMAAVEEQDVSRREYGCHMMAIDKRKLPEIKKYLVGVRGDLHRRFASGGIKDAVYCLAIQFFELTKLKGEL